VGVAPVDLGAKTMDRARKIVFHSVRQVDDQQQFLQKQSQPPAEDSTYLPIVIVLIILFGALSLLLGLWQGPEAMLIPAL
jgi:hypothetical protein